MLNILFAKRRLRQIIDDICSRFSYFVRNPHIFHDSSNICFAKRRLRQKIYDMFHDLLEILIFVMIPWTFLLRKGACGKESMTCFMMFHDCLEILIFVMIVWTFVCEKAPAAKNRWHFSWFSRNSHMFHDVLNLFFCEKAPAAKNIWPILYGFFLSYVFLHNFGTCLDLKTWLIHPKYALRPSLRRKTTWGIIL